MKRFFIIFALTLFISGFGCAQTPIKSNFFSGDDYTDDYYAEEAAKKAMIAREAEQSIQMGLAYCRQGAYEKGACFYLQAAEMYGSADDEENQRLAIVAAAKTQLKISDRPAFLISATQLSGLIGPYEMPSETEQLLLCLAASMQNQEMPYTVKPEHRIIFNH